MDHQLQKVGLYLGAAFPVLFFFGWGLIAGFLLPMPAPGDSTEEIAALFAEDSTRIGIGMIIAVAAAPRQAAMAAAIGMTLRRIEGPYPALAYTQMFMGCVQVLFALVPCIMWAALAFRGDQQDPADVRLLNDFAWLFFVGGFSPPLLQSLCVALIVLRDRRPQPVLPRWVGYYNLWCALIFVPGGICLIATSGPFAWNGILAFWIPAAAFGAWFYVMFFATLRALNDERTVPH